MEVFREEFLSKDNSGFITVSVVNGEIRITVAKPDEPEASISISAAQAIRIADHLGDLANLPVVD